MKFTVVKGVTGRLRVKYQCPQCSELLENALSDAGNTDVCPVCRKGFVVPGEAEKQKYESEAAKRAAEREKQKSDAVRLKMDRQRVANETQHRIEEDKQRQADAAVQQQRLQSQRYEEWIAANRSDFTYRVVPFSPVHPIESQLAGLINYEAQNGWEFVTLEIIQTYQPAGCLGSLWGMHGTHYSNHLAIFRKRVAK